MVRVSEKKGSSMARLIALAASASAVDLQPSPITPDSIRAGTPEARSKVLAKSQDGTSYIMVWECTAGRFRWHYSEDETVVVIAGEVCLLRMRRAKNVDLDKATWGSFPAGSSCIWLVKSRVKKVAVLRKDLPFPVGLGVRAWHKLLRILGQRSSSSLMPTVNPNPTRA